MRWFIIALAVLLGSCTPGYVVPQAATVLEFSSAAGLEAGSRALEARLVALGFEPPSEADAYPDFMLDGRDAGMRWRLQQARRFWRKRGGLLDRESLNVELTPYPKESADYQVYSGEASLYPRRPFLEVRLSEDRPDGFSKAGFALRSDLLALPFEPGTRQVDVVMPSASDDDAYFRYSLSGLLATAFWWIAIWAISFAMLGSLANALLSRFDWSQTARRIALVAVGVLLATPIPVPAALAVILLPSIFMIWSPMDFADLAFRVGAPMAATFACSFCLSALATLLLVRKRKAVA